MSKSFYTIHEFKAIDVASVQGSVITVTSSTRALNPADSGALIVLNRSAGATITLPAHSQGLVYEMVVGALGSYVIAAQSASIHGALNTPSVAATAASLNTGGTAGTSMTLSSTLALVGDRVRVASDGTKWFLSGSVSAHNAAVVA